MKDKLKSFALATALVLGLFQFTIGFAPELLFWHVVQVLIALPVLVNSHHATFLAVLLFGAGILFAVLSTGWNLLVFVLMWLAVPAAISCLYVGIKFLADNL